MPPDRFGLAGKIADTFNEIVTANERMAKQLDHIAQVVGRDSKTRQRVKFSLSGGAWGEIREKGACPSERKNQVDGRVFFDGGEGARGSGLAGSGAGRDPQVVIAVGPEIDAVAAGMLPADDDGLEFAGHGGDERCTGHWIAFAACCWMILKSRERWQPDSSSQKQPMLMGVRWAICARSSTVWRPAASPSSSRS
mgnify:CR=1 FL=1